MSFRIFPVLMAVLTLIGAMDACARPRERRNLCDELWGQKLSTYVADPVDSSGNSGASMQTLRSVLEDTLRSRLNISFVIVRGPEGADIEINCDIKEFVWSGGGESEDKGGAGFSLLNAFSGRDTGRIEAVLTVKDLAKKKVMWEDRLRADVNAKGVPEEEGIEMLNERLAQIFMRECFGKKRLRAAAPVRSAEEGGSP